MSSKMRRLALFILKLYQKFFTLFSYGSCRYYPTCSEYAKWQILNNNFFEACLYSFLRILRCNQLFPGGINYPVVKKMFYVSCITMSRPTSVKIKFWFVPKSNNRFYVVKAFNN